MRIRGPVEKQAMNARSGARARAHPLTVDRVYASPRLRVGASARRRVGASARSPLRQGVPRVGAFLASRVTAVTNHESQVTSDRSTRPAVACVFALSRGDVQFSTTSKTAG